MEDKFRLLIVNDNPITLEVMRNIVRHHGNINTDVEVLAANSLERIRDNPPYHIIITDLTTPYFTGLDVLRAARARSPDTMVLMIISFGNHQDVIEAIKSGVFDYLHKPFRPDELNLKIHNALRYFQLKVAKMELQAELARLNEQLGQRDGQIQHLEKQIKELKQDLNKYEPEEQPMDLESALARAATEKGGKFLKYNVFRQLTDLESLLDEKRINEEEFHNLRKAVLDRAYQVSSTPITS